MIKIVFVSGDSSLSGAPYHLLGLARGLPKREFDSLIITPPGPLVKLCQKENLKVKEVRMGGPFDRKAIAEIEKEIRKFSPRIIHFHGTRGGWLGRLASRNIRATKVYTEHLWTKNYHLSNYAYEKFQLQGLKFLGRWTDAIIAVSPSVKDFLIKQGFSGKKITVIPNGINEDYLKTSPIKKPEGLPVMLGSVGSLTLRKNYRNTILAIEKIVKENPEINLQYQIVGEGSQRERLENLIKRKKLDKIVYLVGNVDSVAEKLKHFSIFLNVSLSESFGIAAGEAMAVGLPVIASNVDGVKNLVGNECGIKVNPKNQGEIARAILKLAKNLALCRKMGQKSKERIKNNFTEEIMIKKTTDLYRDIS